LAFKIENVAQVGLGTIVHSWATLFSVKGYNISVYDVNYELLGNALEREWVQTFWPRKASYPNQTQRPPCVGLQSLLVRLNVLVKPTMFKNPLSGAMR